MVYEKAMCEFSPLSLNIRIHFQFCCEDEDIFTFTFNFAVKMNTFFTLQVNI